jgi:hypothetical protein
VGDKFKKVQSGQKLKIPAEVWNTLLDVAERDRNQRHGVDSAESAGMRQAGIVKLRNQTGGPLDQFSIVQLDTPIISPADNLNEFKRQLTFNGIVPGATVGSRFAVTLQPLAPNKIGLAVVSGVVAVQLLVDSIVYACAQPTIGSTSLLKNVPHGPAMVLWMENAGAIRWAIIRIDEGNFEEIVLVTSNIPDDQGFYSGVVQRYDLATGSWISQFPCKVLDANR